MFSALHISKISDLINKELLYTLLNVLFFLFCPFAFFAPKFSIVFSILIFFGIFFLTKDTSQNKSNSGYLQFVFLFSSFIMLSTLWSINPLDSLFHGVKISAIFFIGGLYIQRIKKIPSEKIDCFFKNIFLGTVLSALFLIFNHHMGNILEHLTSYTTAKLFAPLSLMTILSVWSILAMRRKPSLSILCCSCFLIFLSLFYTNCDTSIVSLLCSIIGFLMVYYLPRFSIIAFGFCLIVGLFSFPWISIKYFSPDRIAYFNTYIHDDSYLERLNIYHRISKKIKEKPLLGFGFHSSRFLPGNDEKTSWSFIDKNGDTICTKNPTIPLHPHNIFLEIWLELGVIGAILASVFIIFTLGAVYKIQDCFKKAVLMGLYTSITITTLVNLSPWQTWWLSTAFLFIGIFLCTPRRGKTTNES